MTELQSALQFLRACMTSSFVTSTLATLPLARTYASSGYFLPGPRVGIRLLYHSICFGSPPLSMRTMWRNKSAGPVSCGSVEREDELRLESPPLGIAEQLVLVKSSGQEASPNEAPGALSANVHTGSPPGPYTGGASGPREDPKVPSCLLCASRILRGRAPERVLHCTHAPLEDTGCLRWNCECLQWLPGADRVPQYGRRSRDDPVPDEVLHCTHELLEDCTVSSFCAHLQWRHTRAWRRINRIDRVVRHLGPRSETTPLVSGLVTIDGQTYFGSDLGFMEQQLREVNPADLEQYDPDGFAVIRGAWDLRSLE